MAASRTRLGRRQLLKGGLAAMAAPEPAQQDGRVRVIVRVRGCVPVWSPLFSSRSRTM